MDFISSIILTKAGSKWPTTGADIALRTEGAALLGPGPIKRRKGGRNAGGMCMTEPYFLSLRRTIVFRGNDNPRKENPRFSNAVHAERGTHDFSRAFCWPISEVPSRMTLAL